MVLFCLNPIGNPIPNPFNHTAVSLPHSINAVHHLWQWQEDLQDGIYFMEMDVSVICVTPEGKHLQAEKHPQKLSLWVAMCGSEVDTLLLELDFFLKIDVWEKMPVSSFLALPTPHQPPLHPSSAWSYDRCRSLESAKKGLGAHLWNFIGIWPLLGSLPCPDTRLPCSHHVSVLDHLALRTPGKALFVHPPVSKWPIRQTPLLVFSLHLYFLFIFKMQNQAHPTPNMRNIAL